MNGKPPNQAAAHASNQDTWCHLKDLRFGDGGYGMRGDVLVSTLEDCLNVDVVITHPVSVCYKETQ